MNDSTSSCFRCVGGVKICNFCKGVIVKHGILKSGKQRYKCKNCSKTHVDYYTYQACQPQINNSIIQLNNEGIGIRSISRILKISTTTLLRRISIIAASIPSPPIVKCQTYEVDEMCTFVRKKSRLVWIVYALDRTTKAIVSFNVGARTTGTLNVVLKTLKLSEARIIYTDNLPSYRFLFVETFAQHKIHKHKPYRTKEPEYKNPLKKAKQKNNLF